QLAGRMEVGELVPGQDDLRERIGELGAGADGLGHGLEAPRMGTGPLRGLARGEPGTDLRRRVRRAEADQHVVAVRLNRAIDRHDDLRILTAGIVRQDSNTRSLSPRPIPWPAPGPPKPRRGALSAAGPTRPMTRKRCRTRSRAWEHAHLFVGFRQG